ncbi:hypothetical protein NLG97_g7421 [Lecanicillium saksenae]|uniref:Uncharacterized protein n=1 Tax=Lecanicillium saksenae TaxID=468837 RepID=A0ACC1QLV3_9HYPO|nr:hypothetical protein NLG97_g7421 [Lecanicillium saksenae]
MPRSTASGYAPTNSQVRDAVLEGGRVEGQERAARVADDVDLGGARLGPDVSDEAGNLLGRVDDGAQAADEAKGVKGAVRRREDLVALALEELLERHQVAVAVGADAVEQQDRVLGRGVSRLQDVGAG